MNEKRFRMALVVGLGAACLGFGACGNGDDAPATIAPGDPAAAALAAATPASGALAGPSSIAIDAPAQSLEIPTPPAVNFQVADLAEYKVEATSNEADAQLYLYRGTELVGENDDGGQGRNAMLISTLTPGAYQVRLHEHKGQAASIEVRVQKLAPLATAGVVPVGGSFDVSSPAGEYDRAATAEVSFTIEAAGNYVIDATSSSEYDPKIALLRDLEQIEVDDDGGDGRNSRIERSLEPGTYQLRVWDLRRRAAPINVALAAQ